MSQGDDRETPDADGRTRAPPAAVATASPAYALARHLQGARPEVLVTSVLQDSAPAVAVVSASRDAAPALDTADACVVVGVEDLHGRQRERFRGRAAAFVPFDQVHLLPEVRERVGAAGWRRLSPAEREDLYDAVQTSLDYERVDASLLFRSQRELDVPAPEIVGQIPRELRGAFYQNGPGRFELFGETVGHPFDGPPLVARWRFGDGGVDVRARFVSTPLDEEERVAGRLLAHRMGTRPTASLWDSLRPPRLGLPVNVSLGRLQDRLLAMGDMAAAREIDADGLGTVGAGDLRGAEGVELSPHYKVDPTTGDAFAFSLHFFRIQPFLTCWRIPRRGPARRVGTAPLPRMSFVHDFTITATKLVFLVPPMALTVASAARMSLKRGRIMDGLRWFDEPTLAIVVDREGRAPTWQVELPPELPLHLGAAWDDGEDVVVTAPTFPEMGVVAGLDGAPSGRRIATSWPFLHRYTLRRDGRHERVRLAAPPLEFPTSHPLAASRRCRFQYGVRFEQPTQVQKVDLRDDRFLLHDFGPGRFCAPPMFVPRPGSADDDDGWLLVQVTDNVAGNSALAVLDGRSLEELARVVLPSHLPFRLHGLWVPGEA